MQGSGPASSTAERRPRPRPSASRLDAEIVASRVRHESLNRAVAAGAVDPHPPPEPPGYPGGERHQGLRRGVAASSRACGCACADVHAASSAGRSCEATADAPAKYANYTAAIGPKPPVPPLRVTRPPYEHGHEQGADRRQHDEQAPPPPPALFLHHHERDRQPGLL